VVVGRAPGRLVVRTYLEGSLETRSRSAPKPCDEALYSLAEVPLELADDLGWGSGGMRQQGGLRVSRTLKSHVAAATTAAPTRTAGTTYRHTHDTQLAERRSHHHEGVTQRGRGSIQRERCPRMARSEALNRRRCAVERVGAVAPAWGEVCCDPGACNRPSRRYDTMYDPLAWFHTIQYNI
jgi:hypothetical protein